MIRAPWYFCCGWWSPWCFADEWLHRITRSGSDYLPRGLRWVCRRHDAALNRRGERFDRLSR